jgi:cytochrome c-type biogenesis protein
VDWGSRRVRLVSLAVVAALLVAGATWFLLRPRDDDPPQFRFTSVLGNTTMDPLEARGKVVVLDLMAVNCAACKTMVRDVLDPLRAEYAGRDDVVLWSVNVWSHVETADQLRDLQLERNLTWPHAMDDGSVMRRFEPDGLPKLVVLDRDGRVVYYDGVGAYDLDIPSWTGEVRPVIEEALGGQADVVGIPQSGLIGLALFAGAAVVVSPCSVGLLPAYFGMLLQERTDRPGPVRGGLQTAAGVVLVYAGITAVLVPFGAVLAPYLPVFGIVMGALFVVLGVAMLLKVDWSRLLARVRRDRFVPDGHGKGYWMFGIGYAIASFGCTGPIFAPLVLSAFAQGPVVGTGTFLLYAAGVAALLVFVALLAATGRDGPLRWLASKSLWVTRVAAVLWIGAGLYLLWYDLRANAWI